MLALESLLADEIERPLVVVDPAGTIRLANQAASSFLGRPRDRLLGAPLAALVRFEDRARLQRLIDDGLARSCGRDDFDLIAAGGALVAAHVEVRVAAAGVSPALVCRFERRDAPAAPSWPGDWIEIRVDDDFGRITATQAARDRAQVGDLCHRVVAGRDAPCEDCPAARVPLHHTRTGMQLVPSGHLMMRRIHRVSEARAQVAHAPLAGTELTRVIAARLELLATRGGLSARERDVLSQLAIGRSLEQIASSLAISHRTVRFHQGNVLTKLGLSSRHELLLLLLDDS